MVTQEINKRLNRVSEKAQETFQIIIARSNHYISSDDYDFFIYFSPSLLVSVPYETVKTIFTEYVNQLDELQKVGLIGEYYFKRHNYAYYTVYVSNVVI